MGRSRPTTRRTPLPSRHPLWWPALNHLWANQMGAVVAIYAGVHQLAHPYAPASPRLSPPMAFGIGVKVSLLPMHAFGLVHASGGPRLAHRLIVGMHLASLSAGYEAWLGASAWYASPVLCWLCGDSLRRSLCTGHHPSLAD